MRLDVPTSLTYNGVPGAGTFGAWKQGQNALLQQMYANQISRAQAKNAPANQLALTQQNQGAAQTALAGGQFAVPTAQANYLNAQMQPAATQANINLAQAETQNVGNTAQQIAANAAVNRANIAADTYRKTNPNATTAQIISVFHQSLATYFSAITSNLNAATPATTSTSTPAPSNVPATPVTGNNFAPQSTQQNTPTSPVTNFVSGSVPLNGKTYQYTATKLVNGKLGHWVPALNKWIG